MQEMRFKPISQKYLLARRKDETIKRLRYWVAVLAVADVLYTILAGVMIYREMIRLA